MQQATSGVEHSEVASADFEIVVRETPISRLGISLTYGSEIKEKVP